MYKKRNNKSKQYTVTNHVVIRCKFHMRPVYEHQTCSEYKNNSESDTMKSCKNCKHSF